MLKKLLAIKTNHKTNVIILAIKPILATMSFLSLIVAIIPNTKANGGPSNIMNPPRIPSMEPHPKPGQPSNCNPIKNHGDTAKNKLNFPKLLDFIVFSSLNIFRSISLL